MNSVHTKIQTDCINISVTFYILKLAKNMILTVWNLNLKWILYGHVFGSPFPEFCSQYQLLYCVYCNFYSCIILIIPTHSLSCSCLLSMDNALILVISLFLIHSTIKSCNHWGLQVKMNTALHGRGNKFLYSPPKVLVTFLSYVGLINVFSKSKFNFIN